MTLSRPLLLDNVGLRNSRTWLRLKNLFTRQLEEVDENMHPSVIDEVNKEIARLETLPREGPSNILSEDTLPAFKREGEVLQETIVRVGTLVSSDTSGLREDIDKAIKKDEKDLHRMIKNKGKGKAQPEASIIQLRNMEKPYDSPYPILVRYNKASEVMYYIVHEHSLWDSKGGFVPDIWKRIEDSHKWNEAHGKGLHWKFLAGRAKIDENVTALDFVNVAGRQEYMIAAVDEENLEIPVPIDIPRYNDGSSSSLGKHLAESWKSRKVLLARWIGEPVDVDALGMSFDHSNFTPRENELYILCSKISQEQPS